MKIYTKIDGSDNVLEFPVYASHIKLALPYISFPAGDITDDAILAANGYVEVTRVDKPAPAKTVIYTQIPPEKQGDDSWLQKWQSNTKTADEKNNEKALLKKALRVVRQTAEDAGVTLNTMTIDSSAGSQSKLHAVRTKADQSIADDTTYPWTTVNWQGLDGTWYSLSAQDVVDLSDALFDHVEKSFNAMKTVEEKIDTQDLLTDADVADDYATELALL